MRTYLFIPLSFMLLIFYSTEIGASEATERETAMQEKIVSLESQLQNAQQTISNLESELNSHKEELASLQESVADGSPQRVAGAPSVGYISRPSPISELSAKPMSVSSLNPEKLALGGVEDYSRLQYLVPGLRYGQTGNEVRLAMRGARTNSVGPEAVSPVAVYEDGIFIPTSTSRFESFLDVEQIDVSRGPTNSQYGHNAYAGAVNVISKRPVLGEFQVGAEAENAIPDKTQWHLTLNIPVGDTLAFRLAGLSESRSGLINNFLVEPDSDDLNDRNEQTIRSSMLWKPNERFSLLLQRKYQDENGTGLNPWGYQQIGAYIDGELVAGNQFAPDGLIPDLGPHDVFRNFISSAQYEHEINTLNINWNMGFADLQWLSHYSRLQGSQTYDNDYSSKGEFLDSDFAGRSTKEDNISSELRLSSNSEGAFDWVLGLYWFERDSNWGWLASDHGVIFQPSWDVIGEYSTDSKAVFGEASYQISDRLKVSGGLRWNEDSKTLKTGEQGSWDDVLWNVALQYDFNEDLMSYVSASTAYLAGGVNSAPGVNPVWDSETLTAYELGLKGKFADGDVQMSLAAWMNDYKDVQSQSFLVMPFPGSPEATEYTGNGGSMDAQGIEAEIQWTPNEKLYLATNIAYTDASFGDYATANLAGLGDIPGHTQGDVLSYEGWRPALSPEWVVGLQASYTFSFENWGTLTPYLQTTYASDYYVSDLNLPGVRQDAHSRTDFRVIWQANQSFEIQIYFLNYSEKDTLNWARVYNPAARPEITTLQANWNDKATNGIIFSYRFE